MFVNVHVLVSMVTRFLQCDTSQTRRFKVIRKVIEGLTAHFQEYIWITSGLVSSIRRALASKLRGPGFKSRSGTVGGPVTIIMWGARPGWKLALS